MMLVLLVLVSLNVVAQEPIHRALDDQSFASLDKTHGAHLDVRVKKAEDLKMAVRIYTGRFSEDTFSFKKYKVTRLNQRRAMIPYFQLSPSFRKLFLQTLWPKDRLNEKVWRHQVTYAGYETLWSISQWFTGTGQNHRAIRKASGLGSSGIRRGQIINIPRHLLFENLRHDVKVELAEPEDPVFSYTTPVAEEARLMADVKPRVTEASLDATPPLPKPGKIEEKPPIQSSENRKTSNGKQPVITDDLGINDKTPEVIVEQWKTLKSLRRQLRWASDSNGRFASYRLQAGEAIYSAVVVRFCGLVRAGDVNRAAKVIIKRNGIRDETDLAIGTAIRIPYDFLEPEFKAGDDPEYLDYVRNLREVSLVQTQVQTRNLEGVYIILDPGHGGRDPGASQPHFGRVWEDDFVYDIACRIKRKLEEESAATVVFTLLDPSIGYRVQNVRRFHRDNDEVLLTNPRFKLDHKRVATDGVNLRWIFANHHFQKWLDQGVKAENVLFASIHADSLHPSIRGSMIYIPDARANPKKFRNWAKRYRNYKEFKGNQFRFKAREMKMAQARSMAFASNIIEAARRDGVRVHKQKPIRTVVHRNANWSYVPAVVKYNRIPTRCLFEVCNLNNKQDRELMKRPDFRQKIADVFVNAVYKTYGAKDLQSLSRLAETKKQTER